MHAGLQGCAFKQNSAPTAGAIYSRMSSTVIGTNTDLNPSDITYTDI